MLKKHPILSSVLSSTILLAYVSSVSWFMNNAQTFIGKVPEMYAATFMLLLFVFSALISGLLLLGGPIYLYLEKEKKTAVKMLSYNIIFLAAILGTTILILSLR